MKKQLAQLSIFFLILAASQSETHSKPSRLTEQKCPNLLIHYGNGIFNSCKSIRISRFNGDKPLIITKENCNNFDQIIGWLKARFSNELNSPPVRTEQSVSLNYIELFSSDSVPNSQIIEAESELLDIPLNEFTLGPEWQRHILELLALANQSDPKRILLEQICPLPGANKK
jgi:hypothetical protein